MKRSVQLIFAVSFLIIQFGYAQTNPDINSITFSIGPSFPVGNFSSTVPSNSLSGYALPGFSANFSFNHKLNSQLGLTAMLFGQRNGINTKTLKDQLDKTYFFPVAIGAGSPNFQNTGQEEYFDWTIKKAYWYLESIMLGVTKEFSFKKDDKLYFIAKALAGAAYSQSPSLNAKSITDTSYSVLYQNGASAFGFSYLLSAGLNYKLSGKFCLMLDAFYFGTSHLNFKNITQNMASTFGGLQVPGVYNLSNSNHPVFSESSTTQSNKQSFGTINILAGIGLIL